MLIILSPAKTMDMSRSNENIPSTQPFYQKEADFLADKMSQYSVIELEKLLKISKPLAEQNYLRYQEFNKVTNRSRQAIFSYNGSVYKSMGITSFKEADLLYAQEHLRIISTLYGLLRPLDRIQAYRLAYSLKLKGLEEGNLYDYWLPRLSDQLIKDTETAGGILINLASLDVLGTLDMARIKRKVKVLTLEFQEYRNGKYETVRTYAKLARGKMAQYILLNRIESEKDLPDFEWEGFRFNENISNEEKLIFTRKK